MARKKIKDDTGFKPVIKRAAKNPLRSDWSEEMYTPAGLRRGLISESDARKEYTRLRDIAEKRIKRLGKSEFANTQTYRNVQEGFKKLKDIKSQRELSMGLADLARFLSSDTSTVTGLWNARERALETMHQHGFTDINRENFALFGEFMEWARSTFDLMELGSNEVLNWLRRHIVAIKMLPESGYCFPSG